MALNHMKICAALLLIREMQMIIPRDTVSHISTWQGSKSCSHAAGSGQNQAHWEWMDLAGHAEPSVQWWGSCGSFLWFCLRWSHELAGDRGRWGWGVREPRYSEQDPDTGGRVFRNISTGTSLTVQWLRICLPIQGTWVWSLVLEDSTCHRAAKPAHNYWACVLELSSAATEASMPRACILPQAKPPQREARAP